MRLVCVPARRQRQCRSAKTVPDPAAQPVYHTLQCQILNKGAVSPLRYRALQYSPFNGFPDMFRLRDYAMVVPPRPARASLAISMEVMMAWRPFPAFMKSMEASILGSMEPAENWPSFA